MNSQLIVVVQVLIAILFVLWIVSRRGSGPKTTVLNLKDTGEKQTPPTKRSPPTQSSPAQAPLTRKLEPVPFSDDTEVKAKVLNVFFMWNGHGWDAYEVFGLPAGAPIEMVRARYNELQSESDEGQRMFLREALKAIENKISN